MKKLVLGSLNIDKVYQLEKIVMPGQTVRALSYNEFSGGKGLNQAVALARAGEKTCFAGAIGEDGEFLVRLLKENNVDVSRILRRGKVSGHAVIQVESAGQNSIIVYPAANGMITQEDILSFLSDFGAGDLLVLQNEVSQTPAIIKQAKARGMMIALNPSPITDELLSCPLELCDFLILNETEGAVLSGCENESEILESLAKKFPNTSFVLTLGKKGAVYRGADGTCTACGVLDVTVVDTTAAGDTFCGYFLAAIAEGKSPEQALRLATVASNIAITRHGAEPSIPWRQEVDRLLEQSVF